MDSKPFTITSFAWRKEVEDRLAIAGEDFDSVPIILTKLSSLAKFLDCNELVTRRLTDAAGRVDKDFILKSDDLTTLGLALIRNAYEQWQRQAKAPDDVGPLQKALAHLRT